MNHYKRLINRSFLLNREFLELYQNSQGAAVTVPLKTFSKVLTSL